MNNNLEQLYRNVKRLLANEELDKEIERILELYDNSWKENEVSTFGNIFSTGSFMQFERAISNYTEDSIEGFQEFVHKLLGEKNLTKATISKRSGIEESILNRYINGRRAPSIDKVFRIALALELDLIETETLLRKVNMSFRKTPKDAVIIEAIRQKNYDYLAVEAVLRHLTHEEESILTEKEKLEFSNEDWYIEITD